ncbi:LutC/YkgG family protein [Salinactinospora qingdaonensis]|uniref:LUD domain-containing protein n=1 Tax=Salinactinospora qingdaonensis TaxID=702744 RepID=A0ABP7FJ17_9ACTN
MKRARGSRERVLERVRAALADVPAGEAPEDVTVQRDYARAHHTDDLVGLLAERLVDYRAVVRRATTTQVPAVVAAALAERGARRVAVPADLPEAWLSQADITAVADTAEARLGVAELDAVAGVVTGCAVAIAETGTIVLDSGPAQGRRALCLVPDYHLCIVPTACVVADVADALARLEASRPLTWISGPSATSDIELDRVEGVHGPRTLEVVLVDGAG